MQVVSFGIFEVLVSRKTESQNGIYYLMEELLKQHYRTAFSDYVCNHFARLRMRAESNAIRYNEGREFTIEDIYHCFQMLTGINDAQLTELLQLEERTLRSALVPIEKNIDCLKSNLCQGKRVILLSDSCWSEKYIRSILTEIDSVFEELPIYVSCDYNATKTSGMLYKLVSEKEKVSFHDWEHFGCQDKGDWLIPRVLGIETKPLAVEEDEIGKCIWNQLLPGLERELYFGFFKNQSCRSIKNIDYQMGAEISGVLLGAYMEWVAQVCKLRGIKRLYFIARDGYVLKEIFERYNRFYQANVASKYIYGSRCAWRVEGELQASVFSYMEQELDMSDDNFAFVDLQGTGESMSYIQRMLQRNLTCFFYNLTKDEINHELLTLFSYQRWNGCRAGEVLCRAPHGETTGYANRAGKWEPIIAEPGRGIFPKDRIIFYLQGILDFVDYYLKFKSEYNLDMELHNIEECLLSQLDCPTQRIAGYIGDFEFSYDGVEDGFYAPELTEKDIDAYLDDRKNYKGEDFFYSLKRSVPEIEKYCIQQREQRDYYEKLGKFTKRLGIVIYGAGKRGSRLMAQLQQSDKIEVVAWTDAGHEGAMEKGLPVISFSDAKELTYDYMLIAIAGDVAPIKCLLGMAGIDEAKLVSEEEFIELLSK